MIELLGPSTVIAGWSDYCCTECGDVIHSPYTVESVTCGCAGNVQLNPLSPEESEWLFPNEHDPTLIGNRLESLFKVIGIAPCSGCEVRRDWLNRLHRALRGTDFTIPVEQVIPVLECGVQSASQISAALKLRAPSVVLEHCLDQFCQQGKLVSLVIDGQKRYGLPAKSDIMSETH